MPPRRRKSTRRSKRSRIRWGALLISAFLLLLVAYGVFRVEQQLRGYGSAGRHRREAVAPSAPASPVGLPSPLGSAAGSPLPAESAKVAKLAIIIDDCGYSLERDRPFLKLPIPLTLSILPMTPHGREIAQEAQAAGKFVMLHLPMEPESSAANPGPGAITTAMNDAQVQSQVQSDIDSLPPVPGANNHMGSKATSDERVMHDVLDVFRERHLFFIDSVTSGSTVGGSIAKELGVATASRDVFLDNSLDLPYIEGQLEEAQRVALKQGTAIAIGHPNPTTVAALAALIPKLEAAGITFVPAETLVH